MIERVPYYGWPKPTPTDAERIEAWRRKYQLVPIELQCAPIRKPVGLDELFAGIPGQESTCMLRTLFLGTCIAAMAWAVGLEPFTTAWWVWIVAGNAVHAFARPSHMPDNT